MFTTLAAISGSVVLIATKRGDTLKAERDAKRQAELAEQLRRRQERRTFRLSEEMKAKLEAVPAENADLVSNRQRRSRPVNW